MAHTMHQVAYRLARAETTGSVLRRILSALPGDAVASFHLEQHEGTVSRRSPINTVLRRFPELGAWRRKARRGVAGESLSSLDERFRGGRAQDPALAPVAVATLLAIADGIPRSFPFASAVFVLEPRLLRQQDRCSRPATGRWSADIAPDVDGLAGIVLASHWWISRRQIQLCAAAELPAAGGAELDPEAASLLARLGPMAGTFTRRLQSAEELHACERALERGRAVSAAWDEGCAGVLDRLPLVLMPIVRPAREVGPSGVVRAAWAKPRARALRDALEEVFLPRGWRRAPPGPAGGGGGVLAVVRESARGSRLELSFDIGGWSASATGFLTVGVEGGREMALFVPAARGPRRTQYPIDGAGGWRRILLNSALVVDYLEREVVPQLEAALTDE